MKLQMARFLQSTVEEMAVTGRKHKKEAVQEFAQFFENVCVVRSAVLNLIFSSDQGQWTTGVY